MTKIRVVYDSTYLGAEIYRIERRWWYWPFWTLVSFCAGKQRAIDEATSVKAVVFQR